jgi:DnaJ-domain-containing protein 1
LGILTEVVLGLSEHNQPLSANARRSLSQLEELRGRIAAIKDEEVASFAVVVEDWLTKLRVSNSEQFAQIQQQLTAALADTTG